MPDPAMPFPVMWLLVTISLTYITYYTIAGKDRKHLFSSFELQRYCRLTSSRKPGLDASGPTASDSSPTYTDTFPPDRRHALRRLLPSASAHSNAPNQGRFSKRVTPLLPANEAADQKKHPQHLTATGIALQDILDLGDFCDYATLSGVPLPQAYPEFDFAKARPRPYRPFRWAYHQTMSITKMEPDWWLELNHDYKDTIASRQQIYEKHGAAVLQTLPGSEIAVKELMEMCLQFLCARYPHLFRLDKQVRILYNYILGTQFDLKSVPPMHVLLLNVPEDFAIMLRDPESGLYCFRGGIIMSSLGWSLASKIGLNLDEIHKPVPDYKEKMQFSMNRYFSKLPTDKPIQRGSWGLEVDRPLFMPPDDPHSKLRSKQDPDHAIDRMHLRVDWQTLRRLPLSGAIVFNFEALFTPVSEFRDEPYIPSLVLKVLKEGKQSLMEYKDTWHTEHTVIPYLEKCQREQIEAGLIGADWEEQTLDESPFFPGWEEKWHRQQGY